MLLVPILSCISYTCAADISRVEIDRIEYDSRRAIDGGTLFVCLTGARLDGHDFAAKVYEAGCRSFIFEHTVDLPHDAVQVVVNNARESLALLSARIYGNPADQLKLIGITGTKGKTTTAILISEILNSCGIKCAYIGSNGVRIGDKHYGVEKDTSSDPFASLESSSNFLHKNFMR